MPRGGSQGTRKQTYVALLRGINLGGRNKVSMAELRKLFAALGSEDVTTYVQSGNVVFKGPVGSPSALSRDIEERIRSDLGLGVTVLLRTKAQLAKVRAGNPFGKSGNELTKLHVTFLADAPDRARLRELKAKTFDPDEFRVVRREIYLHCPNGYGRTKLNNAYLEKQLGVAATTRNWKTVSKLAELASV